MITSLYELVLKTVRILDIQVLDHFPFLIDQSIP
mgnify:CR=1 FL=1